MDGAYIHGSPYLKYLSEEVYHLTKSVKARVIKRSEHWHDNYDPILLVWNLQNIENRNTVIFRV